MIRWWYGQWSSVLLYEALITLDALHFDQDSTKSWEGKARERNYQDADQLQRTGRQYSK